MLTKRTLRQSVSGLLLVALLSACGPKTLPTSAVTATENALCTEWGGSLPTRSRKDTPQTQKEIGEGYDVFGFACPRHKMPF